MGNDAEDPGALARVLGAQIRKLRLQRGLTLREASARCGLSYQMLGTIEKNGQNTTIEKLEGIARGLRAAVEIVPDPTEETRASPRGDRRDRIGVARRFVRLLPHLPDEEVDVLLAELALWELRYLGAEEGDRSG